MKGSTQSSTAPIVRRSITVRASVERAFEVFTSDMGSWWPRDHHIGKSPMKDIVFEEREGGRIYTTQMDGTDCDWGSVLTWEPPKRVVFAWRITNAWSYEPDLWKSSEVEVRFTPVGDGSTRVDLEHRHLERHGPGFEAMHKGVDSPNGWGLVLAQYMAKVDGGEGAR